MIIEQVRQIKKDQMQMGTEKVYHLLRPFLREHGIKMGRDKLYKLLKTYDLLPKRKRKTAWKTNSNHRFKKYPNLTKELPLNRPNQLWTSDITYIRVGRHFSYLSLITDAYSHKIIGWHLDEGLTAAGPVTALQMALQSRTKSVPPLPLTHHSDRGIQYCSREYTSLLMKHKVQISMARESYENPVSERLNGVLKNELLRPGYVNHEQALDALTYAIYLYNHKRPHRSTDMLTPHQAHQCNGLLKKRWKLNKWRKNKTLLAQRNKANEKAKSVELF